MIIGVDFEHEDQQRRRVDSDSLISPSQRFWSLVQVSWACIIHGIGRLHGCLEMRLYASWLMDSLSTAFEQRYGINWRANEHIWGKQKFISEPEKRLQI